ncbi:KAP family P-loop NTPase fold protein [Colwellia echini]|uniref:NTPase KAP n=1 Tax=Colwellia echini TaxID=1982103 RepID=A0ABY3MVD5_9GAMM|nr:P-loop NTPase fold protein [Colwellia echini]TYK65165.1 NTPase KAP [Colwellia echini]
MTDTIDFDWTEKLEIKSNVSASKLIETFPEDKLERAKYAKFLTKYLKSTSYDDSTSTHLNYVLNLNSEWGAGKSYFLRRWANDLKTQHPVAYIDAWKQDYSEDPLMTVISSMISQLSDQAPKSVTAFKPPKKLIGLLKAAAPAVARGVTKRYLGIDPVKIMESDDEEEIGENIKDENGNPIDMGVAASKIVENLISDHDAKSKAIESLKVTVGLWVKSVIENGKNSPAFIFIDELDRCRPSYAVEMLETIKHIFDIPGVIFVVATDTEQLQHAVKAIYGEGFDARTYLARFFDSRFSLKSPNFNNLLEVHCQKQKLSKEHFDELDILVWPENEGYKLMMDNITAVLSSFHLSTRAAIQITEKVIAITSNLDKNSKLDMLMLTTLLCIREKDEELYEEILSLNFIKLNGDKSITLDNYLSARFSFEAKEILINFNKINKTYFETNIYYSDLSFYIKNIFAPFFDSKCGPTKITSWALGSNQGREQTKEDKVLEELRSLYRDARNNGDRVKGDCANKILEFLNIRSQVNLLRPQFYKDLVEIASAIDWIDDEEVGE